MPEVIVALDVPTVKEARDLVNRIGANWYKVGLELAFADGARDFVQSLPNVFLDLKLSDIPTTVARASKQIAESWRPAMLSVRDAVEEATESVARTNTRIVHVPNLTSDASVGVTPSPAYGIVCRSSLAAQYRSLVPRAKIIVPGIRLPGMPSDDHRESTSSCPEADYLVVGRPITRSTHPRLSYERFSSRPPPR